MKIPIESEGKFRSSRFFPAVGFDSDRIGEGRWKHVEIRSTPFPQGKLQAFERETVERMIRSSVNYRLPESLLRKPRVNLRVSSGQKAYLIYFKPRKLIRPRNTSTGHVSSNIFVFFYDLYNKLKIWLKIWKRCSFIFFFIFVDDFYQGIGRIGIVIFSKYKYKYFI